MDNNTIAQKKNDYQDKFEAAFLEFIGMSQDLDDEIMDMLFEQQCEEHDKMMADRYF